MDLNGIETPLSLIADNVVTEVQEDLLLQDLLMRV